MRRGMRGAAAASILFLAAGTGTAHATSPFGEGFAEGMRVIAAYIAAIDNVDVEVTGIAVVDEAEAEVKIKWTLSNEDSSIADKRDGYCMRVSVADEDWQEECVDEAPASATTYPRVTTYYYANMTVEVPEQERDRYWVSAKVRKRYEGGRYTSWSSEYGSWRWLGGAPTCCGR